MEPFYLVDVFVLFLVVLVFAALAWTHRILRHKRLSGHREKALQNDKELLDKLGRLKNELFQNVYHDMKTPLTVISTSILNIVDMIEFGEADLDEMQKSLVAIQGETMYMSRMLDNAMKLSSTSGQGQDLQLAPMDLGRFITEKSEIYRILLARNKNRLSLKVQDELPQVLANRDMILHVLINLLTNANRYTRGGEISICVTDDNGHVSFTVTDDGSGIKEELLPHIFERGTSDGSTGLGLAICKAVVEDTHGGKIFAKSEFGKGTEIKFTLPALIKN